MDKLMDNPWFLRFTALFLAIVVFFSVKAGEEKSAVGNAQDVIRDIPVDVFYDNENLVVTGVPEKVNITIDGPANIVQTTKLLKDFTLKVDLRSLPMGQHKVRIQAENISDKLQVQIDPANVDVVIEEKITQVFRVDPELNERLLAEDFYVTRIDVDPTTIEVTGAKSVIESISFVKASITADPGINKSFNQQARVRVLDRDLTKLNVTIVPEQVDVKVEVVEYNKEIPIVLKSRGTPVEGVKIDSMTIEEKTIHVTGPRKVLDEIKEFTIDVDVSEVDGPGTLTVDVKKPKGVSKVSLKQVKVEVEATVSDSDAEEPEKEKEKEEEAEAAPDSEPDLDKPDESQKTATRKFDSVHVTVKGLDEKFNSSFRKPIDGLVVLTVTAEQAVIDTLKQSDFTVYVDASGMEDEGEQILPVSVEGPPNVVWALSDEEVTMQIELA